MKKKTSKSNKSLTLTNNDIQQLHSTELDANNVDYDASALTSAKSKWMFGDWDELCRFNIRDYSNHPDRDKIALLIAAGHQQLNNLEEAKKHTHLARTWGCDNQLVAKVLIAGVENSLANMNALTGNTEKAMQYFENSLSLLGNNSEKKVITEGRAVREMSKIGLIPQAAKLVSSRLDETENYKDRPTIQDAKLGMLKTEVELINHNISLSHQKNQHYHIGTEHDSNEDFLDRLKRLSPSQLGQDLWVLEQTSYKRNGFFVEFGATDGILLSNTYLLEKEFGWKGICAEPNPNFVKKLKENRNCIVSDACISGEDGEEVNFILAEEYGGIDTITKIGRHANKVNAYEQVSGSIKLVTISLDNLLTKLNAPTKIDYISVDTEGNEFQILSTFPFNKWNVALWSIEHNFEPQREKIFELMKSLGYRRIQTDWDDWYIKE